MVSNKHYIWHNLSCNAIKIRMDIIVPYELLCNNIMWAIIVMRQFAGGKNNFKTICSLLLASKIWHTATVSYSTYVDVTCIQRWLSKIRILLGRYYKVQFLVYYWVIKLISLFVPYYFSFLTYFQDRCFCGKTHIVG